jgi:hypothetical protein
MVADWLSILNLNEEKLSTGSGRHSLTGSQDDEGGVLGPL